MIPRLISPIYLLQYINPMYTFQSFCCWCTTVRFTHYFRQFNHVRLSLLLLLEGILEWWSKGWSKSNHNYDLLNVERDCDSHGCKLSAKISENVRHGDYIQITAFTSATQNILRRDGNLDI
jgi:hypothetical protein